MRQSKKAATVFVILTLIITVLIFMNSLEPASESQSKSDSIVYKVAEMLKDLGLGAESDDISFVIRKGAHFSEYLLLSLCAAGVVLFAFGKIKFLAAVPIYSFLVAICDEFICQRITEGRSPEWRDVIIDICGALLATAIVYFITYYKRRKNQGGV